jgi:hypothetical protein
MCVYKTNAFGRLTYHNEFKPTQEEKKALDVQDKLIFLASPMETATFSFPFSSASTSALI